MLREDIAPGRGSEYLQSLQWNMGEADGCACWDRVQAIWAGPNASSGDASWQCPYYLEFSLCDRTCREAMAQSHVLLW